MSRTVTDHADLKGQNRTSGKPPLHLHVPLQVVATGVCCPLGYSAPSAIAAMRANMDQFRQSQFIDEQGQPLRVSQLNEVNLWGTDRTAWMFEQALNECRCALRLEDLKQTLIVLLTPERGRPGSDRIWAQELINRASKGKQLHRASRIFHHGKTGLGIALSYVSQCLDRHPSIKQAILVGTDTYLTASTLTHYLEEGRLLSSDNSDGFIPGEAAAALALTRVNPRQPGLSILGLGAAEEAARIDDETLPNKAIGLTQAMRAAAREARTEIADCQFHISANSGESWYFKEAALAVTRAVERRIPTFPHQLIANKVG